MIKIFSSFLISCFIFTIISCGKTTEENVNDAVSKTNNTVFGGTDGGSRDQCTSGGTFQKNIYGRQVKQTNDCGYIVAYREVLTKLDSSGATLWETKITLKQKSIVI